MKYRKHPTPIITTSSVIDHRKIHLTVNEKAYITQQKILHEKKNGPFESEEKAHQYYLQQAKDIEKKDLYSRYKQWMIYLEISPISRSHFVTRYPLGRTPKSNSVTCVKSEFDTGITVGRLHKNDEGLYKFVSKKPNSLAEGELFVADIKNGRWISLDLKKNSKLK